MIFDGVGVENARCPRQFPIVLILLKVFTIIADERPKKPLIVIDGPCSDQPVKGERVEALLRAERESGSWRDILGRHL